MPLSGRRLLLGMLAILVVIVGSIAGLSFSCRAKDPQLKDLGVIPPFQLVDERGQPFTEAALAGHVTIVSFLFTRCDTICPTTTLKMQRIQEKTFDVGDKVKLLSFSVDPEYDTPERLAAYAVHYKADPARWRFVTGPAATVHGLVEGPFMTSMLREADRPGGVPNIAHGGYFMLIGPDRVIRGKYDSNDLNELDELIHAARYLARVSL